MMWIAAYLYLAGICASLLFAWDNNVKTSTWRFALFVPVWPFVFPAILAWAVVAGTFDALRDRYRRA